MQTIRSRLRAPAGLALIFLFSYLSMKIYIFILNDSLNAAAVNGDRAGVEFLLRLGASLHGRSLHFMTPLMSAAEGGHTELVRLLLDRGADVNAHNDSGSVLFWGVASGKAEMVSLILERGADVRWRNALGGTARELAEEYHRPDVITLIEQAERPR